MSGLWDKIDGFYYNPFDTKKEYPLCELCTTELPYHYLHDCKINGCFNHKCFNLKKSKKLEKKLKEKKYIFITLQDFQRRLSDLDKLKLFIKRIAYMYDAGFWILEGGSQDPPNVHLHMLVKVSDHVRNHKQVLAAKWSALFDTNLYDKDYYKINQWRKSPKMPDYEDWYQEKLDYFDQDKKSSHINKIDIGLRGTFGDPT